LTPFFSGHGSILVVVPSGDAVVAALSTGAPAVAVGIRLAELHLLDPLRHAAPTFFNWDHSYNTAFPIERSRFLSQLLSNFLELLHVCLHINEVQFSLQNCYDVKVLICDDD
jgi:hypothetical protein